MIQVHNGLPVSYCTLMCQDEVDEVSLSCLLKYIDFIHNNYIILGAMEKVVEVDDLCTVIHHDSCL